MYQSCHDVGIGVWVFSLLLISWPLCVYKEEEEGARYAQGNLLMVSIGPQQQQQYSMHFRSPFIIAVSIALKYFLSRTSQPEADVCACVAGFKKERIRIPNSSPTMSARFRSRVSIQSKSDGVIKTQTRFSLFFVQNYHTTITEEWSITSLAIWTYIASFDCFLFFLRWFTHIHPHAINAPPTRDKGGVKVHKDMMFINHLASMLLLHLWAITSLILWYSKHADTHLARDP